jgi:hypothetical protein
MNKHKLIESMDDLFANFEKIDMNKLDNFLHQILKLFDDIQVKLKSTDEKDKAEALELAQILQDKLGNLAERAFAASGLSKDKIEQVLSNPANFKPQDWETFKKIEQEMSEYKQNLAPNHPTH